MPTTNVTEYRAQGAIILERLSGTTAPVGLKAYIVAFKKAHDDYEAAAVVADKARDQDEGGDQCFDKGEAAS